MHAVKVGWGGQTFALAKCSDSGGKKSRVRRSKEERKSMVESFIKKYQKSNNGSFPSLNLTHKEVGGSFYTVREIVREVIQENRVLGPAKLTEDDQDTDQIFGQYSLGSISTNPSSHLSLSLDADNNVFITSEPHIVNGVGKSNEELSQSQKQIVDSIGNINGVLVDNQYVEPHTSELDEQYEEADTSKSPSLSHAEEEELDTDFKTRQDGVGNSSVTSSEFTSLERDVVVETFPLRSATILAHNTERNSEELGKITGILDVKGTEVEVASKLEKSGLHVDVLYKDDLMLGVSDQTEGAIGLQPEVTPNEHQTTSTDANDASASHGESISQEAVKIKAKTEVSSSSDSHVNKGSESVSQAVAVEAKADSNNINEGKSATLNRPKLESWEGASKQPAKEGHNPVFAAFRAIISAFLKFWTE